MDSSLEFAFKEELSSRERIPTFDVDEKLLDSPFETLFRVLWL
jgi:hypothetical protein